LIRRRALACDVRGDEGEREREAGPAPKAVSRSASWKRDGGIRSYLRRFEASRIVLGRSTKRGDAA
jgi:hypothetical protein